MQNRVLFTNLMLNHTQIIHFLNQVPKPDWPAIHTPTSHTDTYHITLSAVWTRSYIVLTSSGITSTQLFQAFYTSLPDRPI